MDPKIIYEDEDLLGVDKPPGLMVHSDGRSEDPTLADWLGKNYPALRGVGEPLRLSSGRIIDRPGIVHRIDRETSGVLLVAKTQLAFEHFKKQFQEKAVIKRYAAFVYGKLPGPEGVIDRPIGKSRKDFRMWSAQRGARGTMREAVTEYAVLEAREGFSYVEARPKTGRTHQIRVHFKAIHHPIVCDRLYAPNQECALGFSRIALHAKSITVKRLGGEMLTLEAVFPKDFERALAVFHDLPPVAP